MAYTIGELHSEVTHLRERLRLRIQDLSNEGREQYKVGLAEIQSALNIVEQIESFVLNLSKDEVLLDDFLSHIVEADVSEAIFMADSKSLFNGKISTQRFLNLIQRIHDNVFGEGFFVELNTKSKNESKRQSPDDFLQSLESKFQAEQSAREKRFAEDVTRKSELINQRLEQVSSEVEAALNEIRALTSSTRTEVDEKSSESVQFIERRVDQTDKAMRDAVEGVIRLREQIGGQALSKSFGDRADEESTRANWFRIFAIVLMILAASVILVPYGIDFFRGDATAHYSLEAIFSRLSISTLLLVPAGYMAREAGKHRQAERDSHGLKLQLEALDPFIAKLPEDLQHEVKAKLVATFFTGVSPTLSKGRPAAETPSAVVAELLREILARLPQDRSPG